MSTATQVSLEQYLRSNSKPECEFIDGVALAKPLGTREHMRMERRLERLLETYESRGLGEAVHELSVRKGNDIRIPDLAFVPAGARVEDGILLDPPLLCVEVLSPSQRQSELFAKCEVYHSWGVRYCWVIDPISKIAWEYHNDSPVRTAEAAGRLCAGEISVAVQDLF